MTFNRMLYCRSWKQPKGNPQTDVDGQTLDTDAGELLFQTLMSVSYAVSPGHVAPDLSVAAECWLKIVRSGRWQTATVRLVVRMNAC